MPRRAKSRAKDPAEKKAPKSAPARSKTDDEAASPDGEVVAARVAKKPSAEPKARAKSKKKPAAKTKKKKAAAEDADGGDDDDGPGAGSGGGKSLVIVESPAKARTIGKYLGRNYIVRASVGHVMDLPPSKLGVDVDHDFAPTYEVLKGKVTVLKDIAAAARKATAIYLAPDPDREGEAIAWHLAEYVKKNVKPVPKIIQRVVFNEITKKAVQDAFKTPRGLDDKLFESQQARRIVDRLVGYQISPILWSKVRRGLSAGRVQSVAVRVVVDREREIQKFVPVEYWSIDVTVAGRLERNREPDFVAKLFRQYGGKVELPDGATAKKVVSEIEKAELKVTEVQRKERRRFAPPPFTTSKLQQEASRKLRFSPKRTMGIAQSLYEGVDLGDQGTTGLITYMRTDSVRVADSAIADVRELIKAKFGAPNLPETATVFKTKKGAQDAHEAVRPTNVAIEPEDLKPFLDREQLALYTLIWQRFVASQMIPAVYDQTTADIAAGPHVLRASGSILKEAGFLRVYHEAADEDAAKAAVPGAEGTEEPIDETERRLPPLEAGDLLDRKAITPEQHFTQPPPRFSEASLVKELEEKGIGRPSTYASILSTIQARDYVKRDDSGRLLPTQLGFLITDLLVQNFPDILDIAFTADLENKLDSVEDGSVDWVALLKKFYGPFASRLEDARKLMRDVKTEATPTEFKCEKCGKPLVIKWGRNGEFLACSGYPDCRNTKEFKRKDDGSLEVIEAEPTGEKCPVCSSNMFVKRGRFGRYIACDRYPTDCKTTMPFSMGVKCPKCALGDLVEKRSRRGKYFYGCSRWKPIPKTEEEKAAEKAAAKAAKKAGVKFVKRPFAARKGKGEEGNGAEKVKPERPAVAPDSCDYVSWYKPINEPCPQCGSTFLVERWTKRTGAYKACPNKTCDYKLIPEEPQGDVPDMGGPAEI